MAGDLNPPQEIRIAIRFNTTNVPGTPIDRCKRIAKDFATLILTRNFSYTYDFIHLPADFYSNAPKGLWMLCDFNVFEMLPQVEKVPIQFWKVSYGQQQSPNFTECKMSGKVFADRFPWGGRDNEWKYRLQHRNIKGSSEALVKRE